MHHKKFKPPPPQKLFIISKVHSAEGIQFNEFFFIFFPSLPSEKLSKSRWICLTYLHDEIGKKLQSPLELISPLLSTATAIIMNGNWNYFMRKLEWKKISLMSRIMQTNSWEKLWLVFFLNNHENSLLHLNTIFWEKIFRFAMNKMQIRLNIYFLEALPRLIKENLQHKFLWSCLAQGMLEKGG